MALARVGIAEAVAPLGTALTEAQLERLWRIADVPLLCFDGDAAGRKAAVRAAHRALPLLAPGKSLAFVALPAGQDPDDLVRAGGAAAFEAAVSAASPLLPTLFAAERAALDTASPEGRAALREQLQTRAATIGHSFVRQEYGRAFNTLFWEEFGWKKRERDAVGAAIVATGSLAKPQIYRSFVRSALYGLFRYPAMIAGAIEQVARLQLRDDDLKRWFDHIVEYGIRQPPDPHDGVKAILETTAVPEARAAILKADFRFLWTIEEAAATRRLDGLLHFLAAETDVDARLEEVAARIRRDERLEHYPALAAELRLAQAEKAALLDMGYELGAAADGQATA